MRVLSIVLDYLSFLPPAILCFLPMKDQLRYSRRRITATVGYVMVVAMFAFGSLQYFFGFESNLLLLPMLEVCFFVYHRTQKATFWQSLSILCASVALMSILSNMALCSAILFFGGGGTGLQAPLLQLCFNAAISVLLASPYAKYGSRIVNEMRQDCIWQMMFLFSVIVFLANMLLIPIEEAVAQSPVQTGFMLLVLAAVLLLFLLMHMIFYITVFAILEQKKIEARNHFLEMQESQFAAQQRYLKETEKARHDFRQSIRTLAELYESGDQEAVGRYIHQYSSALPASEVRSFSSNLPLNALLNYYDHIAQQEGIPFSIRVRLPETLPVSDVDLCSMVGNILDNAVAACRRAEEKRMQLSVLTEDAAQLYIVAVNTFNGVVKQADGRYLSRDRRGYGIGLTSVISTAENYGGVARFSHRGTEFYSNVAIPLAWCGEGGEPVYESV